MNQLSLREVEEKLAFLWQPDELLSADFLTTLRRTTPLEPEKRLLLAVLKDAVDCFQNYLFARTAKGKTIFREVEEWLKEEDGDRLFSFKSVCEILGLDPEYMRRGLKQWKERRLAEHTTAKIYPLTPRRKGENARGRTLRKLEQESPTAGLRRANSKTQK